MTQKLSPKLLTLVFSVLVLCFLATLYIFAWTEPSVAPPGGNVATPLNTSSTTQTKTGELRFPIFRDSDNTAYYVDPYNATTSAIFRSRVGIGTTTPSVPLQVGTGSIVVQGFSNVVVGTLSGMELGASPFGLWGLIRVGYPEGFFQPLDIQASALRVGPYIAGEPIVPDRPFLVVGTVEGRHTATFESLPGAAGGQIAMGIGIGHLYQGGVNYRHIQAFNRNWSDGSVSWENLAINMFGGNVGIGTASPGAKLEVAGQVKITGGSPGAGKILTSDASGLASWQTPGGGGPVSGGLYGWCKYQISFTASWCVEAKAPAMCIGFLNPVCGCPTGYTRVVTGTSEAIPDPTSAERYYTCYKE